MPVTFAMCAYVCIVGLWQSACYLQLNRHQFQATPHRNSSATGVEARLGKLVGARGRLRASRCGVAGMWRRGRAEQPAAEKRVRPRMLLAAVEAMGTTIAGAAALLAVVDGRKLSCRVRRPPGTAAPWPPSAPPRPRRRDPTAAGGGQERRRPYVAQAPFSSMHHDVCSLAHSRKANLILLPSKIKVSHRGCRGGQRSGHGHRGCKSRRAGEPPLRACEEVPSLPLWARASCCRGHTG